MWRAILLSAAFIHQASSQQPPGGYYTTRYDHIDIERILNQKRLVHYYAECLLDRGPCTPQGIEFKHILPEALRTNCLRCTEKQHFVALKSIRRLRKEYPDVWAELAQIWDPTGAFTKSFEESLDQKYHRGPDAAQTQPISAAALPLTMASTPSSAIANKPLSFAITTPASASTSLRPPPPPSRPGTTQPPIHIDPLANLHSLKTTTMQLLTSILQEKERLVPTTHRIAYNYDFAASIRTRPLSNPGANTPVAMVIRGVNNIIQPITDLAGRVITAGTDIAGAVLSAIGIRRDN